MATGLAPPAWAGEPEAEATAPAPLRIAISQRPANAPLWLAEAAGWLEEAGAVLEPSDYVASLDAFAAGHADACVMLGGDALVIGATTARRATAILPAGLSLGADVLLARAGVGRVADLRATRVGVEVGFASHRLLLGALARAGLPPASVRLVNAPPETWQELLSSGAVAALAAWEPGAAELRAALPDLVELHRSDAADALYELLYVSRESLAQRRDDWRRVLGVWLRGAAALDASEPRADSVERLALHLDRTPAEVEALLGTVQRPARDRALAFWRAALDADRTADAASRAAGLYTEPEAGPAYHDTTLLEEVLGGAAAHEPAPPAAVDTGPPDGFGLVPTEGP